MEIKKRYIGLFFSVPVTLLIVSLMVGETGANYFSEDTRAYPTQQGELRVELVDTDSVPEHIEVNHPYTRRVSVKNKGAVSQFIRVMALPEMVDVDGVLINSAVTESLKELNTTEWQDGQDGYYYYLKKLKGNEETPSLFNQVGSVHSGKLTLHLKVEAITAEGDAYEQAWWNNQVPTESGPLVEIKQVLVTQTE